MSERKEQESNLEDEALQALEELMQRLEGRQAAGLEILAQRQAQRKGRREAVLKRLSGQLPDEDPTVDRIRRAVKGAENLELAARQRLSRMKDRPPADADDWTVTGNVRYADGQPGQGLRVQVYLAEKRETEPVATTATNERGDFTVVYNTYRFPKGKDEELPELYLRVVDRQGNELATTETGLRPQAGQEDFIQLVLRMKEQGPRKSR